MADYSKEIQTKNARLSQINKELQSAKGKKKRKLKQERRRLSRRVEKLTRMQNRSSRKEDRNDTEVEKIEVRQEGRTERSEQRNSRREVAYQNGIDPLGNALEGIGGIVGNAGTAASQIMGAKNDLNRTRKMDAGNIKDNGNGMIMILIAAILFLFSVKKR